MVCRNADQLCVSEYRGIYNTSAAVCNSRCCGLLWVLSLIHIYAKGQGPAWSNSLFEDNAEFGYGMLLAQRAIRGGLKEKIEDLVANGTNEDVKTAGQEWLDTYADVYKRQP